MKKSIAILIIALMSMTACADSKQQITYNDLPEKAQVFIAKYFDTAAISYVERERDDFFVEYNVYLNDATKINFDHKGQLESVDGHHKPLPQGIVPDAIAAYVAQHYPMAFIVEYSIDMHSQKVELSIELELIFNLQGSFLRIDD